MSPTILTTSYNWLKEKPKVTVVILGCLLLVVFLLIGDTKVTEQSQERIKQPKIISLQEVVDPRAIWSEDLSNKINHLTAKLEQSVALQQEQHKLEFSQLKQELNHLKQDVKVKVEIPAEIEVVEKPKPVEKAKFVHLGQSFQQIKSKKPEHYVSSGSFARAVLLTGIVSETGTAAVAAAQPVLLRLVDHGIFSKGYKTEQIKEAILIGACHGNISSERAICRLVSISLAAKDGSIIEKEVEGWLIGEDGRPGIRGEIVDRSSDVARMAVFNGILGGMAGFLQNQAQASIFPISPISGPTNALKGQQALKSAGASGVGNALQKLADYAIKRAEQMNPVIIVGAGRVIDVVFKKGFSLNDEHKAAKTVATTSHLVREKSENVNLRELGRHEAMTSLTGLQMGEGDY